MSARTAVLLGWVLALVPLAGCDTETLQQGSGERPKSDPSKPVRKVELAPNIALEVQGNTRRVLVTTEVCLREGQLEQLLTRKKTKEHEAILTAEIDARQLHTALVAAQAKPGSPVKY